MFRGRRPISCGGASRRRTTKRGDARRRTSPPRPRPARRTSRKKTALCDKAEALAGSTSWIQTAEEIKRMQAEWKTIGPVSRGREKAVWDRFRAACDRFFTRRQEDLVARKGMWAENLAKKEALSVRAEALVESTDWEQTSAELRRLQAEWKTIGPVKKSRSEAIWRRFREACDRFFTRYAHRHDIARAERVAAREAICAELEALAVARTPGAARRSRSSRCGRFAPACSRRSPRAAWIPNRRERSRRVGRPRSPRCSLAGPPRSATPTSTPRRTASGWNRWYAAWRIWPLLSPVRWPPPRATRRCRRRLAWRRCSRKRSRPIRSAEKSTTTAGGAPRWKKSGTRRKAGRASAWFPTTSGVP